MKNKKGIGGILLFVSILFIIFVVAFIAAMAVGIIEYTSGIITPVMEDIGVVGESNVSQAAEYSFGVADKFANALPWLVGFLFVIALVFSVVFAVAVGAEASPAMMGVYLAFVVLLVFGGIVLSNMYENIYSGDDIVATSLQSQTITSYMILHAPWIIAIIALITGIYLFTRGIGGGGIYP